ncbi:MAG: transcription termination factor NusA [Pyrinomonadaceae bacterium]
MTTIGQSIEALCNEQGLDRELVIEAMKEAVKAAARKQFKSQDKTGESIEVEWNNEEGMVEISAHKTVVAEVVNPSTELSLEDAIEMTGDDEIEVGDMLLIPLPTEELGRIAAQTAKQILVQKVREAVREKVYEEYVDRIGTLINGVVKRFERGDIIVDLGNNLEAILPRSEQSRSETWNQGERIRVVIEDVTKDLRGQQIKVSRSSAELLKRLFEMEVPEIYDETVIIKSAVREPGDRAKIAVASNEKDVDPVGACVGMKGSRVQSIIKELRGEKIDIIEWSDEPSVFAANALSPAKVSQVRITDINNRKMEVIVNEDQLSLAIGKRGQNVRLATRLVGWDIDIISEDLLKKEIAQKMGKMMAAGEAVPITALEGVSVAQADSLRDGGIEDVEKLAETSIDDLVEVLDISMDEALGILSAAQDIVKAKAEQTETEGQEEESEDGAQGSSEEVIETAVDEGTESVSEGEEEDQEKVIEAMKEAARKQFKSQDKTGESIEVEWNNEEGMVEISAHKTVVAEVVNPSTELSLEDAIEMTGDDEIEVGDVLLIPLTSEELNPIAEESEGAAEKVETEETVDASESADEVGETESLSEENGENPENEGSEDDSSKN